MLMPKNILFDKKKIQASERLNQAPICPVSGRPMDKVICGSFDRKKMYAWFSPHSKLVLPVFKSDN